MKTTTSGTSPLPHTKDLVLRAEERATTGLKLLQDNQITQAIQYLRAAASLAQAHLAAEERPTTP